MRIALVHSTGTLWLAGDPALAERSHSSAGGFRIIPRINVQEDGFVNGSEMTHTDRGNLAATLSFGTSRQFATPAAAEIWSAMYDSVMPRAGSLLLQSIEGSTASYAGYFGCVVQPPQRQVIGCSVQLEYSVLCGLAESVTYATAILGSTGSDNAILFTAAFPGTSGNTPTVTIAGIASATAAVVVGVTGSAITITPAAKGVMTTSSITSPTAANKALYHAGTYGGKPAWSTDGINDITTQGTRGICYYSTDRWLYQYCVSGSAVYVATKVSSAAFPDGLTGWTLIIGTGSPTVTATATTAAMAIAAVNASVDAAALVVASNVTGYSGLAIIAAVSLTHLTGGTGL